VEFGLSLIAAVLCHPPSCPMTIALRIACLRGSSIPLSLHFRAGLPWLALLLEGRRQGDVNLLFRHCLEGGGGGMWLRGSRGVGLLGRGLIRSSSAEGATILGSCPSAGGSTAYEVMEAYRDR
jgi:hypothetical protein